VTQAGQHAEQAAPGAPLRARAAGAACRCLTLAGGGTAGYGAPVATITNVGQQRGVCSRVSCAALTGRRENESPP